MRREKQPHFVTALEFDGPESPEYITYSRWGGNEGTGHLPFQLKFIRNYQEIAYHYEGLSFTAIKRRSSKDKELGLTDSHYYFYPNDILTDLSFIGDIPRRYPRGHLYSNSETNKEYLANLYFCYIDFDPKGSDEDSISMERHSLLSKLEEFSIQPDVIIDSGKGIHAYWAIKSIRILDLTPTDMGIVLYDFHLVQELLCRHFNSDPHTATSNPRVMRIPETWNIKSGSPRRCRYIKGDLAVARLKPLLTLTRLRATLKKTVKRPKRRIAKKKTFRPELPKNITWQVALYNLKQRLGIIRVNKPIEHLFRYLFQYSTAGLIPGGTTIRNKTGLDGASLKLALDFYSTHELISITGEADYRLRKARRIDLQQKFYDFTGIPAPRLIQDFVTLEKQNEIIQEVINHPLPLRQRRSTMPMLLRRLVKEAKIYDPKRLQSILYSCLENRPDNLDRGNKTRGDIDHLIRTHWLLKKIYNGEVPI